MKIHIKGGRIIDPSQGIDRLADIYIHEGRFAESHPGEGSITVDARGLWVVPGLIDAHVHLREPGEVHKETVETGLAAAAAGGFTAVLPMPNTTPANDNVSLTRWLVDRARDLGGTRIFPVPAITIGRKGRDLVPMADLIKAGAVAFSDDGSGLVDDAVMERALAMAARLAVPISQHSEFSDLSAGGVVHDGTVSRSLGLPGWPVEAEERMVERDISLVKKTGGRLHVSHISTGGAINLVRRAKASGLPVTAEVTPHHLHLTDEVLRDGSTNAKVNPPLRPAEHVEACRAALADGTIDIVATDHAPHTAKDKEGGFIGAAFGMIGLEIAVPLLLLLVNEGILTATRMIAAMSTRPAEIFGLPGGTLRPGAPADLTLIDPDLPHEIDPSRFSTKCANTPFTGWKVSGRAVSIYVDGNRNRLS